MKSLLVCAWVAAIGVSWYFLWRYDMTAGQIGAVPSAWPSDSSLRRHESLPTLLVFAHPRCACTRATLAELERLVGRVGTRMSATLVVIAPPGAERDWDNADLVPVLREIPWVNRVIDEGGREATRFGAMTSGHAVLYSPEGSLLFSGGLTSARGHEGASRGQEAIVNAVSRGGAADDREDVFGCGLGVAERREMEN